MVMSMLLPINLRQTLIKRLLYLLSQSHMVKGLMCRLRDRLYRCFYL